MGDPTGFPRIILYELRPFQIVQTSNQVLILYMFEKRWRVIWTDGRALPTNPDPRWYGYSVGRWVDDQPLVVNTVGTDDRTWLDNAGNPHSNSLRVEERYRRVNQRTMELTVTLTDPLVYAKAWVAGGQDANQPDAERQRSDGDDSVRIRSGRLPARHRESGENHEITGECHAKDGHRGAGCSR
jgi:hypothetical protein